MAKECHGGISKLIDFSRIIQIIAFELILVDALKLLRHFKGGYTEIALVRPKVINARCYFYQYVNFILY